MGLLEVRDLKVHYPVRGKLFRKKQWVKAVDGVSFSIEPGEIVGLVGESGCGKSTIGKAIVKLEKVHSGSILLKGREISSISGRAAKKIRKDFQMIFQDPYGSLNPRLTVAASIDEVLAIHTSLKKKERRQKIAELLQKVGIDPEIMDRYPHQFSGGQRQRIGIARALAAEPALIVADEPVSALDVSVQASIINLLDELKTTTGISFLFIAHDLAVVAHISTRIMVMYLGHLVETAPSEVLVNNCHHPYTQALLSAVPELAPDAKTGGTRIVLKGDLPSPLAPPDGCPFNPRCIYADDTCRCNRPPMRPMPDGSHVACFHPLNISNEDPKNGKTPA